MASALYVTVLFPAGSEGFLVLQSSARVATRLILILFHLLPPFPFYLDSSSTSVFIFFFFLIIFLFFSFFAPYIFIYYPLFKHSFCFFLAVLRRTAFLILIRIVPWCLTCYNRKSPPTPYSASVCLWQTPWSHPTVLCRVRP